MDQLGGYRIVRKLGEGPRAELLLARTDGESESEASVALKHYRTTVDDASITTEIEALARAAGDHAVELLDVATAPSGSLVLVLDHVPGGSLGRLLALRPTLELGELPTILAPLGGMLDRMHAAGVVHRGIRLESVRFDRAGAPMLACFGRAELIGVALPPAGLEAAPGVHADQRALASIAAAVLDRADDRVAVRDLSEWVATSADECRVGWGAELATRVSAIAPGVPVDFAPPPLPIEARIPGRIVTDAPPARRPVASSRSSRHGHRSPRERPVVERRTREARPTVEPQEGRDEPWHRGIPPDADLLRRPAPGDPPRGSRAVAKPAMDAAGAPDWITALIPADVLGRVRASLAAVRTPVWIAAGLVGVALVAAIVLVPQDGSGVAADPAPTGSPLPTPTAPGNGWTPTRAGADPVQADDPVQAVVALLHARAECLQERSVLCLDAVGQLGSPGLDDDQRLVRALQEGAETPTAFLVDADQVTLVERLGDTALLSLDGVAETQPASILLMRTEAGWRIRDYLD